MRAELVKEPAVLATLNRLWSCLGHEAFEVVDHWDCDLRAIGIASKRDHGVLIYFSINDDRYDVELEMPPHPADDFPYREAGQYSGLDFDGLTSVVREHLSQAKE